MRLRGRVYPVFLVLLGVACSDPQVDGERASLPGVEGIPVVNLQDRCVAGFDPSVDYFPDRIAVRHAQRFQISYHGHYKVLEVRTPTLSDGGGEVRDVMVLVQCGTPVPPLEGALAGAHVVEVPIRTLATNEDRSVTRARVLGALDRLVAVGDGGIYDRGVRERWASGEVLEIGASFHGAPNYERLLQLEPDATFLSTASLAHAGSLQRARELGIRAAPILSWSEPTVLGQAEWLKHMAVFLNAEAEAEAIFGEIEGRYLALRERAAGAPERPLVVWLDPDGPRGQWAVPAANWIAQAIEDAGGENPFRDEEGPERSTVTTELIVQRAGDARFFLTESVALAEPGSTGVLEALPALREGRLMDVHRRSIPQEDAYDWYESAVVEVDRVLEDLVALFHPALLPDHAFHHLRAARSPPPP